MKYIRTKDRIEEMLAKERELIFTKHGYISRDMVIKEADTIEELFDEVVLKASETAAFFIDICYWGNLNDEIARNPEWPEVYASVFTNRGLIYVAKLNEKGEWELL